MFGTKAKPERPDWFRVVRRPTNDEWGAYDVVDANGRIIETEHDLRKALDDAAYMNRHVHKRAA